MKAVAHRNNLDNITQRYKQLRF